MLNTVRKCSLALTSRPGTKSKQLVVEWMNEGISTAAIGRWARHVVMRFQKRVAQLIHVTALPQPSGYARHVRPQAISAET